jgi:hypothetical protein
MVVHPNKGVDTGVKMDEGSNEEEHISIDNVSA